MQAEAPIYKNAIKMLEYETFKLFEPRNEEEKI